jgi:hypothetical protein
MYNFLLFKKLMILYKILLYGDLQHGPRVMEFYLNKILPIIWVPSIEWSWYLAIGP